MNTKTLFGFMVAAIIALFAVGSVMALSGSMAINTLDVKANDVELLNGVNTLAGSPGETIPVVVTFSTFQDYQDVKVRVWIDGYKSDVSASTSRFDVVNGSTYIKRLVLTLPSVEDMDNLTEGLTLYVRLADKNDASEDSYDIKMQRESYSLEFLSVDAPIRASAGEIIALDVVLKNIGARDAEDTFVTAAIPELGISKKAYFGDLVSQDITDSNDNEDARERRIYLVIPSDAKSGDYSIDVKASNYDATSAVRKVISITGLATANNATAINAATGDKEGIPTSIIVLTVVLVIIFVVLLVVLIVLLTKKPSERTEEFGESYY
jgi:hypothetical protein